ncbi:MAG: SDR family oxidoreductase [Balneolales bacterium]|nr:SDR family oxidoreductase [Balneolales bacterium]
MNKESESNGDQMNTDCIIITGASRGIGYAASMAAAKKGYTVIAIARSKKQLEELKALYPKQIFTLNLDASNPAELASVSEFLDTNSLRIRSLIHNAGALINKPFLETTDDDWQKMLDVNLMIPVRLTKICHPFFTDNAHILHIGSMGGFQGSGKFPGLAAYSASKAAVSVLTECLSAEFATDKIAVNCLCLGAVQTEMLEQAFPGFSAPVNANEMGEYVLDFALHAQKFFNGKVLPVSLADPA